MAITATAMAARTIATSSEMSMIDDETVDVMLRDFDLERILFVRFREAWIEGDELHVRARLGSESSRAHYAWAFARLREHPSYVSDADDPDDYLYVIFRFSPVPDRWKVSVSGMKLRR